ncbi:MAG TPA: acyl-CoA dehydrogenase family protein [Steroidobacteraceae bacterium]|nr:acyl-CoA dehydrogenase family protein [Steroidobacteraceae bacterium]
MDFRYTEEQLALQDTLQRFISRDYDFERRRALTHSELGYSAQAWARFAELGVLALPFPEELGGLGGTGVDVMLVMEQIGRGLLLEPFLSTVVLGGRLLQDLAPEATRAALFPRLIDGRLRLAFAGYEAAGRYDLTHVACRAVRAGNGWRLSGTKTVVLDAPSADAFLVVARTGGQDTDRAGISLFLVPREAVGLAVEGYATQSGSRAADLRLADVTLGDEALLGVVDQALPAIERAVDRALAALCAEALGIVSALNKATLEYLKSRRQFGVAIGNFQALQHRMAEMYIAEEQIRSMTIMAAVNADLEDAAKRSRAVCAAKAYVGEAARFVGQQAVQLHGAMGVVDELIVSHYFKRLTVLDLTFGDADYHLGRFSDSMKRAPGRA